MTPANGSYKRDMPFRAPETIPEHQARLLNQAWYRLEAGRQAMVEASFEANRG